MLVTYTVYLLASVGADHVSVSLATDGARSIGLLSRSFWGRATTLTVESGNSNVNVSPPDTV